MFVKGKELWGHLDGSSAAPTAIPELRTGEAEDARIITWILGSIEPHMVSNLRSFSTLELEIGNFSQENFSIEQYYSRFLNFWSEYSDIVNAKVPQVALSTIQIVHEERKHLHLCVATRRTKISYSSWIRSGTGEFESSECCLCRARKRKKRKDPLSTTAARILVTLQPAVRKMRTQLKSARFVLKTGKYTPLKLLSKLHLCKMLCCPTSQYQSTYSHPRDGPTDDNYNTLPLVFKVGEEILDSGASNHMTGKSELLQNIGSYNGP
ncbi:hypothetical protein CR513_18052, partial [Mucuna pruriens]